jgi:hypothetical protein
MKRYLKGAVFCAAMIALLLTAGCSGWKPFEDPVKEGESLVFGYIDMSDAPISLQWVSMKRLRPVTEAPYYRFVVADGLFYRTATLPGTYKFESFGGEGWNTRYTFSFPVQGRGAMDPIIDKTGIYYVGAYKYKKVKTGFFEQGKFEVEKVDKPGEKELLLRLLKTAEHPSWKAAIKKRIEALN